MSIDISNLGTDRPKIDVKISYRIIQLFSEGLYSSPNKAVEELVANAFDAGAQHVHVVISPDLNAKDSSIVVVDDGTGMDEGGLRFHWQIGVSNKRNKNTKYPRNRRQIGKFGIGKLATYVLASRLTHISKVSGKFFATSMDFTQIPHGEDDGIHTEQQISLPLKELSERQARIALDNLLNGDRPGHKAIKLFGSRSSKNWTVALLTELKQMATDIQIGRLKWVLQTAMPLRDDFELFLNGEPVIPSKVKAKKIGRWTLGKDLTKIPKPAPDELQVTINNKVKKKSDEKYGLTHGRLGRITGYLELYEDLLTTGKSSDFDRSHGFFVYVRGRMVNIDDEYFGIDSNLLRHGTFARFRMVVNIDKLDEELRSSRETVRQGELFSLARNILHGAFNFARTTLEDHISKSLPGVRTAKRIASAPASLAQVPIVALIEEVLDGKATARLIRIPHITDKRQRDLFLKSVKARLASEAFVSKVVHEDISYNSPLAIYDSESAELRINSLHPFVAYFLDEFADESRSLPLELLAWSEVLLEASLHKYGISGTQINDILIQRDELLRHLAKATGKRNALMIAQDLMDSVTDKNKLENELVAAFDCMGFQAIPKGGAGNPDGLATAVLSAASPGQAQRYTVSLEAKSKIDPSKKVSAKTVGISAIARQRDDYKCDHALVVGPDFPTTKDRTSALVKEIKADNKRSGKTITLIRVTDLARLVRLVPLKRIHLGKIRQLFQDCLTPEESAKWIDTMVAQQRDDHHYKEILQTIWQEQDEAPSEIVEYASLWTALRKGSKLTFGKEEVIDICRALSRMAPEFVFAREGSVELTQRPDRILQAIGSTIKQYPPSERKVETEGKAARRGSDRRRT